MDWQSKRFIAWMLTNVFISGAMALKMIGGSEGVEAWKWNLTGYLAAESVTKAADLVSKNKS